MMDGTLGAAATTCKYLLLTGWCFAQQQDLKGKKWVRCITFKITANEYSLFSQVEGAGVAAQSPGTEARV